MPETLPSPRGTDAARPGGRAKFPAFVYRDGDDPDPRFSLANERTFLAWMRTSLALAAAAVGLDLTLTSTGVHLQPSVAVLALTASAFFTTVVAWLRWARVERAMRRHEPLPSPGAAAVLVVLVIASLTAALVELWTR